MTEWILKLFKPFIVWLGSVHFPYTKKKITGKEYYRWRDKIRTGDIILSTTNGELSNLINPSIIKHGSIYIGKRNGPICYVSEAIGVGVVQTDLVTHLLSKDIVVVVRPKFKFSKKAVKNNAISRHGKEYDYLFDFSNKSYYCFEHVAMCFPDQELEKTALLGHNYYDYTTFLEDQERFEVVMDSRRGA